MSTMTFNGAPTTLREINSYQRAKETMRLVKAAKQSLEALDNQDRIDLNSSLGTVVVPNPQPTKDLIRLAGTSEQQRVTSVRGESQGHKMSATIQGDPVQLVHYLDLAKLEYRDSPEQTSYLCDFRTYNHSRPLGKLSVIEDKATGTLCFEQECKPETQYRSQFGLLMQEAHYGPNGPMIGEDTGLYSQGNDLKRSLDSEMKKLLALDNSPNDLNPEIGVIAVADFGSQLAEKPTPAGADAILRFDPKTGHILEYQRGSEESEWVSFHRLGDRAIYQNNGLGQHLEILADGSRSQQRFSVSESTDLSKTFEHERQVSVGFLERHSDLQHSRPLVKHLAYGLAAAAAVVGFAGLPLAVGAAATGTGLALMLENDDYRISVRPGISRFSGSDQAARLEHASQAMDYICTKETGLKQLKADNISREDLLGFASKAEQDCSYSKFAILVDQLGQEGQPALVVIPRLNDLHFPIRIQDDCIQVLGGGPTIPLKSVRRLGECVV